VKKHTLIAAGLALGMALGAGTARAVEVYKSDNANVDIGLRMQLQGNLEYTSNSAFVAATQLTYTAGDDSTGNASRDQVRVLMFQKQNRLTLDGSLDGVKVKFDAPFGADAYSGSNNLYNLYELSAEFNVPLLGEEASVVAGLARMPWNISSATGDKDSLFTDRSELNNLFFNAGYDTTVFLKQRLGLLDYAFGVEQGAANLPQRFIPEGLNLPVPMFLRVGVGNLKEDSSRFRQMNFGKIEETQWAMHANAFWAKDSQAGHGALFSQMGSQAELSKGPFINGNYIFQKGFNPFAGYNTGPGGLADPDNEYWYASVDAQFRLPMGDAALVFGGQYAVNQYVAKGMNSLKAGSLTQYNRPILYRDGVKTEYNFAQLTNQGGEIYVGYVAENWAVAARVDMLIADKLMGTAGSGLTAATMGTSFFGDLPVYEITFPAITYKLNSYTKFIAESEFTVNSPEFVDTNGVYQLKTVPMEYSVVNNQNPVMHNSTVAKARLMCQVAF